MKSPSGRCRLSADLLLATHGRTASHTPPAHRLASPTQLLGELIEEHGSSEGFGVLIADAGESWYLENAASHHWLAQRIPDAAFFASANQHRFQARRAAGCTSSLGAAERPCSVLR